MSDTRVATRPYIIGGSQTSFVVPAAAGWTPASVTTAFWYDATVLGSITKDGSNNVSQWNDLSGNARHLTQATALNKPVYTTGAINALPALQWSAANPTDMTTASFTLAQPFLIMIVYRNLTFSPGSFPILIDDAAESGAGRPIMFSGRTDISEDSAIYGGVSNLSTTIAAASNTSYYIYGGFGGEGGGNSATRTTGGAEQTGSIGGSGFANGIIVGGINVSDSFLTAYIGEIFCIPNYSGTDKANALTYVQAKWGV